MERKLLGRIGIEKDPHSSAKHADEDKKGCLLVHCWHQLKSENAAKYEIPGIFFLHFREIKYFTQKLSQHTF